jgi:hypothetical protein
LNYIFLIPCLLSLYYVAKGKVDTAFLNIYLPCLLLLPTYFAFRIPHLPEFSASQGALIPIAISLLVRPVTKWKFRRMDLWVTLFMVSIALSELLREPDPKLGIFFWVDAFAEMFLAYIVGRQIIEPNLRLETVKRFVFLLLCIMPLVLYEYRFQQNPYANWQARYFGGITGSSFRGGHIRIMACYTHSILAGMVFLVGIALNYYLVQIYKRDKALLGPRMMWLQKYRICFFVLPLALYLTGSRGPMLAAVLCILIMQIPRFKSVRTGTIVVLLVLVAGGAGLYAFYQKYTSVPEGGAISESDEQRTSAIYRKEMKINYAPVLEAGGWLGYGASDHPHAGNQISIDDDYMLVQLSQGKLGWLIFVAITFESLLTMFQFSTRYKSRETLFLVFSLMAAFAGLFATLTQVWMGGQIPEILFLLLGWSQSLQDTGASRSHAIEAPEPKFRFRRVIA